MARSQPSDPPQKTNGICSNLSFARSINTPCPLITFTALSIYSKFKENKHKHEQNRSAHSLQTHRFAVFSDHTTMEAAPKGAAGRRADRKKSVSKSVKAGLQFPVGRVARYLRNGRYARRLGTGAPIYLAAVLEYLAAEVIFKQCMQRIKQFKFINVIILTEFRNAGVGVGWKCRT